jgi:hypothetical protein
MKRTFGLLLVGSVLVAGMATAVLAASPGDGVRDFVGVGSQSGNGHAWGFADTNSDRVNDNFVDADDDGTCDNFVDENEDGINDLRGTRGIGGQGGQGGQGTRGTGTCDGSGFVDADIDGVCDNAGNGGRHLRTGGNGPGRTP